VKRGYRRGGVCKKNNVEKGRCGPTTTKQQNTKTTNGTCRVVRSGCLVVGKKKKPTRREVGVGEGGGSRWGRGKGA